MQDKGNIASSNEKSKKNIAFISPCFKTFSNTEKGVETNTTGSGIYLTNLAVFGNVM